MVTIYYIEDINDLKYVGSTKQTLPQRLATHRADKKNGKNCSSKKLNLYYCIIYSLEECTEENRTERERYHINNIDCVNTRKLNYHDYEKTKDERNKRRREKYAEKKLLLNPTI